MIRLIKAITGQTPKPRLVGDHISEYVVGEPGYPTVRVVRSEDGWALKTGAFFSRTYSIVADLDTAIQWACKLSRHLHERELAEIPIAKKKHQGGGA